MYSVIILDDEPLVSLELVDLIDNSGLPLDVVGHFTDPFKAEDYLRSHQVDLAFIDVKMPRKSGIEVLKDLELNPMPLVVMISAYSDGLLVRDAFRHGARDYVIKTELNAGVLTTLYEKYEKDLAGTPVFGRRPESVSDDLLIISLMNGSIRPDDLDAGAREQMARYGDSRQYVLKFMTHSRYGSPRREIQKQLFRTAVEQILAKSPLRWVIWNPDWTAIYVMAIEEPNPKKKDSGRIRRTVESVAEEFSKWVNQYLGLIPSLAVSPGGRGIKDWVSLVEYVDSLGELTFQDGPGGVYFPEDRRKVPEPVSGWTPPGTGSLMMRIESHDPAWREDLESWFSRVFESGAADRNTVLKTYRRLLWDLMKQAGEAGPDWEVLDIGNPTDALESCFFRSDAESLIRDVVALIVDSRSRSGRLVKDNPSFIDKARYIIATHYSEPLTLNEVADTIGISVYYLSRLFHRETGLPFHDYLAEYRVEQAIRLFPSGLKIYEIGEKVGYANSSHFSKVFKRVKGMSPHAFRKRESERA